MKPDPTLFRVILVVGVIVGVIFLLSYYSAHNSKRCSYYIKTQEAMPVGDGFIMTDVYECKQWEKIDGAK
jgi:hypothetical protein